MKTKSGKVSLEEFFVERLQCLLESQKISRYKLSRLIGISQSSLSLIMSRKSVPSLHTIDSIVEGLGITMAEFFGDEVPDSAVILTAEEKRMLELWRNMRRIDRLMVYAFAQGLEAKKKTDR